MLMEHLLDGRHGSKSGVTKEVSQLEHPPSELDLGCEPSPSLLLPWCPVHAVSPVRAVTWQTVGMPPGGPQLNSQCLE